MHAGYGLQFGEIYPVTFQQVRFSPPGSVKIVVTAPDILDPLNSPGADPRGNLYLLDPHLRAPYEHQYNFTWEPDVSDKWRLQLGYVGSRAQRLLIMWYLNRAVPVAGIPQTTATINQRRPDQRYADERYVLNGSRGYFDALRLSFAVRGGKGFRRLPRTGSAKPSISGAHTAAPPTTSIRGYPAASRSLKRRRT